MSKPLDTGRLRQLLLRLTSGLSQRQISLDMGLSRKTVAKYSAIITNHTHSTEQLSALSDEDLFSAIYPPQGPAVSRPKETNRRFFLLEQSAYYQTELTRPGVTMQLLWQEYSGSQDKPYGYASFCKILKTAFLTQKTAFHNHYRPGEVLMIDFAGDHLAYIDKETGERISCVVFASVLGYSNYTYAEVLPSAGLPFLIKALNNNLRYIQGVPVFVLTDNMAQLVKKTDRYEPGFTKVAEDWANHNATMLQTARVAHPKDKSAIEGHVKIIYQRIYATLRNRDFYSIQELNEAVFEKLKIHNHTNFHNRTYSRYDQFIKEELGKLQPLPDQEFRMQKYTLAKVQKNYHILLGEDKHFYSVPFIHVGKTVQVNYTTEVVEIYHQMVRIAIHTRETSTYGYTTTDEHMPAAHQFYAGSRGYNSQDFLDMAQKIGPNTLAYVVKMLQSRKHEAHAYNSCLGLLRLGKQDSYGSKRLEKACGMGLNLMMQSYKTIENILKNNADNRKETPGQQAPIIHKNLRGPDAF